MKGAWPAGFLRFWRVLVRGSGPLCFRFRLLRDAFRSSRHQRLCFVASQWSRPVDRDQRSSLSTPSRPSRRRRACRRVHTPASGRQLAAPPRRRVSVSRSFSLLPARWPSGSSTRRVRRSVHAPAPTCRRASACSALSRCWSCSLGRPSSPTHRHRCRVDPLPDVGERILAPQVPGAMTHSLDRAVAMGSVSALERAPRSFGRRLLIGTSLVRSVRAQPGAADGVGAERTAGQRGVTTRRQPFWPSRRDISAHE